MSKNTTHALHKLLSGNLEADWLNSLPETSGHLYTSYRGIAVFCPEPRDLAIRASV